MRTFALYCPEISCLLLFQANHRLHRKLACVNILLIFKTHFRDDHASRCNGVILACLLLQNTDCCRVGSAWLRWIRDITAAFRVRATPRIRASPSPVGAVTAVHYYLLLLLLLLLLLRKSWGYAIISRYHFTPRGPFMLRKLNLLVMSRRVRLLIYILRRHHRVCLQIWLPLLLIWIYRTRIGRFSSSISIHEISEQPYIRLILKQVVIKLFLQELCENVKLILVWFIHIFIPKFRNNLKII